MLAIAKHATASALHILALTSSLVIGAVLVVSYPAASLHVYSGSRIVHRTGLSANTVLHFLGRSPGTCERGPWARREGAVSVMGCLHRAGELCADEDVAAAKSLCDDGVLPDAELEVGEICVVSDGTCFKLQGPEGGLTTLCWTDF